MSTNKGIKINTPTFRVKCATITKSIIGFNRNISFAIDFKCFANFVFHIILRDFTEC